MKISIALCTYEGATFLPAQLASILTQHRLPDEVVVRDDGSTDATPRVIAEFAAKARFPVRTSASPKRAGSTASFEAAIRLCEGDLVVLCDQDDVWRADRLASLERAAEATDADLLFSDATFIDEDGGRLAGSLWRRIGFTPGERRAVDRGDAFGVLIRHNVVTGATAAFRSRVREQVLPIPEGVVHDRWIAAIIAAGGKVVALDEPLIDYRLHARQQIGVTRKQPGRLGYEHHEFVAWARELELIEERIAIVAPGSFHSRALLREKIAHLRLRSALPGTMLQRSTATTRELFSGRYHRHSNGVRSFLKDLLLGDREAEPPREKRHESQ